MDGDPPPGPGRARTLVRGTVVRRRASSQPRTAVRRQGLDRTNVCHDPGSAVLPSRTSVRPPAPVPGAVPAPIAAKEPRHGHQQAADRPPAADPRLHRGQHQPSGATRRRCARSARPSASPRPPPSTPTSTTLQRLGYLRRDPTKPRAIEVRYDPTSGAADRPPPGAPRPAGRRRGRRHRRAGPGERRGGPAPAGRLHRRGRAVHAAGPGRLDDRRRHPRRRLRRRPRRRPPPSKGDIVVAGIPGEEATVKTYSTAERPGRAVPANERLEPMEFRPTRSPSSAGSSR